MSDVAGKAYGASASGSTDLVPNMSDGFATGAGAAGFQQASRRDSDNDQQTGKNG